LTAATSERAVAYVFEAKSIQAFILAGGRLRDIVGASLLVDSLCLERPTEGHTAVGLPASGLLDDALDACGLVPGDQLGFTRRAAGAFIFVAVGSDMAERVTRFRRLWTLLVGQAAPGLEFIDMLGGGATAPEALRAALADGQGRRSRLPVQLPLAPPPAVRAPRTGLGAVAIDRAGSSEAEPIDAATKRKRSFFEVHRDRRAWWTAKLPERCWPADMEDEFPFLGQDRTVAVMHADGNRMGQILIALEQSAASAVASARLPDDALGETEKAYLARLQAFSTTVGQSTQDAFDTACARHLSEAPVPDGSAFLPARPILMGGDDLTIILRGDIALDFAATFLETFEAETSRRLAALRSELPDLPPLTACAGLAFVGDSQPFDRALALAEDLCRYAKQAAKKASLAVTKSQTGAVSTTLAFHRATASLLETYDDSLASELSVRDADGRVQYLLTMQPYATGAPGSTMSLPRLADLKHLRDMLRDDRLGRGPARELIALLSQTAPAEARRRYARWRQVLAARAGSGLLAEFDKVLQSLGTRGESHFDSGDDGEPVTTPLGDAITWHVVTRGSLADDAEEATA
jgi:hypothetical protein